MYNLGRMLLYLQKNVTKKQKKNKICLKFQSLLPPFISWNCLKKYGVEPRVLTNPETVDIDKKAIYSCLSCENKAQILEVFFFILPGCEIKD